MPVLDLDTSSFDSALASSDRPVLVDFWAPWCGPCRLLAPVLERISVERPDLLVAKLNVDESPEIAARYGVRSIPFVARFDGGALSAHSVGAMPKAQLLSALGL